MKRKVILKIKDIFSEKEKLSKWFYLSENLKEAIKHKKKFHKTILEEGRKSFLFKNFKDIGNHLFKQNNYSSAKDLYSISLVLIPTNRKIDRSLNFSNRAQCLIFLDQKLQSLIDCTSALKLQFKHDKSWYRKIFVIKRFKDHLSCLKIISIVHSLSVKFSRNHACIQNEFYGKNIIRLEMVTLKKKYGGNYFISEKNIFRSKNSLKLDSQAVFFLLELMKIIYIISKLFVSFICICNTFNSLFFFELNSRNRSNFKFIFNFKTNENYLKSIPKERLLFSKFLIKISSLFKTTL